MRDIVGKAVPKETIYKDVVVIGNGPSGISLSYMLSGHWPYWNSDKIKNHPDELLRARLNFADNTKSLVMQDLVSLADGLEGRSTNPVSLLLDSLQNPCADLGMELPSMLNYKYHPDKQIDHIVLGKGPPGGSWHRMDPNLRTLSLSAWMSLPGLDFNTWEASHPSKLEFINNNNNSSQIIDQQISNITDISNNRTNKKLKNILECRKCAELQEKTSLNQRCNPSMVNNNESENGALCCKCSKVSSQLGLNEEKKKYYSRVNGYSRIEAISNNDIKEHLPVHALTVPTILPRRNLTLKRQVSKEVQTRALVSRVAEYYENYVTKMDLNKYFANDTIVTSITPLCAKETRFRNARWIVQGTKSSGKSFSFACKSVIMANGASDLANRLGLRGENLGISWIKHELPQLEVALEKLTARERSKLKPVLVVGAGLSAADAVTICRSAQVPVIHVYRNKTAGLDKMLPENVYPEYHAVHKMMKDSSNTYELYTPLAEHTITEISTISSTPGNHSVTVQHLRTGETKKVQISFCAILIGARPDLRFLTNIGLKPEELRRNVCLPNNKTIEENDEQFSLLNRKITWFKNLCLKCKHINFCEWSRRNDYKKMCGHNYIKYCECNKIITNTQPNIEDMKLYRLSTEENASAIGLGEDPSKPIDCKSNPIAVDKYTNEVLNAPTGLYAMGPLVGDNFVRFIPGGALAITSALHKEND